ncbi:MAG: SBBP repeat-containing protein, partial [Pseudomonadota bacterium]
MTSIFRAASVALLALFSCNALGSSVASPPAQGVLSFIEANEGQAHRAYSHVARVPGYTALLSADDALFMMPVREADNGKPDMPAAVSSVAMQMRLLGASTLAEATESGLLEGHSNYLRGADPDNWVTGLSHFERLRYADVYPGIDILYTLQNDAIRYDFVVSPQADPGQIQLGFTGVTNVEVAHDGTLHVRSATAELTHTAPVIFQEIDGETLAVEGGFVRTEDGNLRFQVAAHVADEPLVIDPQVSFSTLLGGSDSDGGQDITVDPTGRMIVVGTTSSVDFPLADQSPPGLTGDVDLFVVRLAADGQSLEYATYIGGSQEENPHQVELDADGNMVIAGYTASSDYPTVNAAQPAFLGGGQFNSDAFITKLAADGASLIYSTFLGGSAPPASFFGFEWIRGLALDAQGNAFVTGETSSDDFPATQTLNGRACLDGEAGLLSPLIGDGFVAKYTDAGVLEYAVCFGAEERDTGRGIALGADGSVHVVGFTRSTTFPTTPGAFQPSLASPDYDGHVTHFAADGSAILSSTLVGGSFYEFTQQVRVAPDGSRVVIGSTASDDFPTTLGSLQPQSGNALFDEDATLYRVSADASQLLFSTYFGGFAGETGWGLELDANGRIIFSGFTSSPDFPLKDALQGDLGGAASLEDSIGTSIDNTQAVDADTFFGQTGTFGVV